MPATCQHPRGQLACSGTGRGLPPPPHPMAATTGTPVCKERAVTEGLVFVTPWGFFILKKSLYPGSYKRSIFSKSRGPPGEPVDHCM